MLSLNTDCDWLLLFQWFSIYIIHENRFGFVSTVADIKAVSRRTRFHVWRFYMHLLIRRTSSSRTVKLQLKEGSWWPLMTTSEISTRWCSPWIPTRLDRDKSRNKFELLFTSGTKKDRKYIYGEGSGICIVKALWRQITTRRVCVCVSVKAIAGAGSITTYLFTHIFYVL